MASLEDRAAIKRLTSTDADLRVPVGTTGSQPLSEEDVRATRRSTPTVPLDPYPAIV
jgi:hypothetical protein